MKRIIEIRSVDGSSFVIGKRHGQVYLENEYTTIPNEFELYNTDEVEKLFIDLCDRIPECDPVDTTSGHPNYCVKVIYEDKSEQIYKETDRGKNLCAYTARTARYSEFFDPPVFGGRSDTITLDHLKKVCEDKEEDYAVFLKAIKDFREDDYTSIKERILPDGGVAIDEICYSVRTEGIITIESQGKITGNKNQLKFVSLMEKEGVVMKQGTFKGFCKKYTM